LRTICPTSVPGTPGKGEVGWAKRSCRLAALRAIEAGRQAALRAPTEILADQHLEKSPAGLSRSA